SSGEADAADRLSFGNVLLRTETARAGSGETRQLVTTWSYLPGGSRVEKRRGPYYADPLGNEIPGQSTPALRLTYDAHERPIRIDYGSVQTADGSMQALPSHHFSYDAHGCLTDVRIDGLRTHYDYFADPLRSGFVERRIEDADGLARVTEYEIDNL